MQCIDDILSRYVKNIQGKVLGLEIHNSKVISQIEKNPQIVECNLLSQSSTSPSDGTTKTRNKIVKYNEIRKQFGKKKYDIILCDYRFIGKYRRRFISDSLYLSKQNIYIVVAKEDFDIIEGKYQRYHVPLNVVECSDGYILKIDASRATTHFVRDTVYLLADYIFDIIDIVGDIILK